MKYLKTFNESLYHNLILYHGSNTIHEIQKFKNNTYWTINDYIAATYAYNHGGLMYETKISLNPFIIEQKSENLEECYPGGPRMGGTDKELINLFNKLGYVAAVDLYKQLGDSKGISHLINGNFQPFIEYAKSLNKGYDSLKFKDEAFDAGGIVSDTYIIFDGVQIEIIDIFEIDWGNYGNCTIKSKLTGKLLENVLFEDVKKIIQRNLPLNQKYSLLHTIHKSLIDGDCVGCENCGKLIANIATVKGENDNKTYLIGMDCLETFLINNKLLDGESVEEFNKAKRSLPKAISILKSIKEFLDANTFIDEVIIDFPKMFSYKWIATNYLSNGKVKWNDGYKVKDFDINLLMNSLNNSKFKDKVKFKLKTN